MKKLNVLFFVAAMTALSGCSVIGDIFKAGAYFDICRSILCDYYCVDNKQI